MAGLLAVSTNWRGGRLAHPAGVTWLFERESERIICEIRRSTDDEEAFEFEMADAEGPTTLRFASPSDLIRKYLCEQSKLMAKGWRPRNLSTLK